MLFFLHFGKFFVLHFDWSDDFPYCRYKRIFSIGTLAVTTYNPSTLEITNQVYSHLKISICSAGQFVPFLLCRAFFIVLLISSGYTMNSYQSNRRHDRHKVRMSSLFRFALGGKVTLCDFLRNTLRRYYLKLLYICPNFRMQSRKQRLDSIKSFSLNFCIHHRGTGAWKVGIESTS